MIPLKRLARALFVLDQRESHVAVAVVAEADAGAYGYLGFGQQELRKLQRAEVPVGLGDLRPDEHGGLGQRDVPAGLVESFDEHVAAACDSSRESRRRTPAGLRGRVCDATWMGVKVP